jgi:hypothetical protein
MESIRALIQHVFYSDKVALGVVLFSSRVDLEKDSTKGDRLVTVGGYFVVIPI